MSTDLSTALHDLSGEQPLQPVDRLALVTRRAGRIRRTRAVASAAAVLALALPIGLLVIDRGADTTPSMIAESSPAMETWPERSSSYDEGKSLLALQDFASRGGDVSDVRWLHRGYVDGGVETGDVVVFLASRDGRRVAVTGWVRGPVDLESDGGSRWNLSEQPVDRPLVGLYVSEASAGPDRPATNTVVVVTRPGVESGTWTAPALPGAPDGSSVEGDLTGSDGVLVSEDVVLTGPVDVRVAGAAPLPLTVGAVPLLARPAAAPLPTGAQQLVAKGFQSTLEVDGRWTVTGLEVGIAARELVVRLRCYGGGQVEVQLLPLLDPMSAGGQAPTTGRVACDGVARAPFDPVVGFPRGYSLTFTTDRLQAYDLRVGEPS